MAAYPSTPSDCDDGGAGPSLDTATLTVVAYPGCAEAVIYQERCTDPARRISRQQEREALYESWIRGDQPTFDVIAPIDYGPRDPSRSIYESARRAKTAVRRWAVHHKVDRLWTFTYDDDHLPGDLDQGWKDVEDFRRRMSQAGLPPMLLVPEWGDKSGRFHFHGAAHGFIDLDLLKSLWGKGFVHVRRAQKVKAQSARDRSRAIAGYVSGYVTKNAEGAAASASGAAGAAAPRTVGRCRKRYSIPKGSKVRPVHRRCTSLVTAWREAEALCSGGRRMRRVWSSDDAEDWRGPPTILLQE